MGTSSSTSAAWSTTACGWGRSRRSRISMAFGLDVPRCHAGDQGARAALAGRLLRRQRTTGATASGLRADAAAAGGVLGASRRTNRLRPARVYGAPARRSAASRTSRPTCAPCRRGTSTSWSSTAMHRPAICLARRETGRREHAGLAAAGRTAAAAPFNVQLLGRGQRDLGLRRHRRRRRSTAGEYPAVYGVAPELWPAGAAAGRRAEPNGDDARLAAAAVIKALGCEPGEAPFGGFPRTTTRREVRRSLPRAMP